MLAAPEARGPVPGCSELVPPLPLPLPLPQPGEEEEAGASGGVGVGMMGHTDGTGESMGGVGGVVRGVRGPGARRGPFNCGRICGSSMKTNNRETNIERNVKYDAERIKALILQSQKA